MCSGRKRDRGASDAQRRMAQSAVRPRSKSGTDRTTAANVVQNMRPERGGEVMRRPGPETLPQPLEKKRTNTPPISQKSRAVVKYKKK
mmetsp:Transcript_8390/g.18324  ORF Transcript_8390/g.18324 Transcript_8390/m.18324 type:complete len:88 (-) Transcript_8390:600-863(-)